MKHYWADDASRTGNKEMSQVSSPAGGLWCPLWAARAQIPHEVGVWNASLTPRVLGAEVRWCQAAGWRSSWYLQYSTWLQGAEAGAAQTRLCFPALTRGPGQCTAAPAQLELPSSSPGNQSLAVGDAGRDWHLREHSDMLSAWGECMEDALVAFHGFISSLVVLPCLQKEKERKRDIFCQLVPRLLSHGVRAVVLGSRHFCSSKDESQTK